MASAGDRSRIAQVRAECAIHYTVKAFLKNQSLLIRIDILSDRFAIAMHAPKGISSRLAFFNSYYWKIAGLTACYFQWNSWKLLNLISRVKALTKGIQSRLTLTSIKFEIAF